ncbi:hypothetical protein MesoLjLc_21010 [Mesorhizobium sp. L-8-10]|nr:hypothetical protein [Mesorhizobium sp. L-8-10]BCH30171.1 hypothetical protein MesoLjLc_21010 [Mesorhizobium sp. L-8-10]
MLLETIAAFLTGEQVEAEKEQLVVPVRSVVLKEERQALYV